jgi:hypothetical protein
MKTEQLKKILRPLIKECVREIIFEDGTLSTIISEVVKGTSGVVLETKENNKQQPDLSREISKRQEKLREHKNKMLDAIGRDAYNGVNLFEGVTPTSSPRNNSNNPHGSQPLDGIDPRDPGVDLSSFANSKVWKKLAGN